MTAESRYADWIAVDGHLDGLGAWAMGADGTVKAEARADTLDADDVEATLLAVIEPWLGQGHMPVIACGLAQASVAWAAVPPIAVPARPRDLSPVATACTDPRLRLLRVPGLSQSSPADLMAGDETRIAGFLAANPNFDGILCLPGLHTAWVHVSAEEVVSFQTAMTGELFRLLTQSSTLRAAVSARDMDANALVDAVDETLSRPERLGQRMRSLHAAHLLQGAAPSVGRAQLAGGLIGAELAAAKPYWLGQAVAIAGRSEWADLYASALEGQGVAPTRVDADLLTQVGLARFRAAFKDTGS